jgi:Tfp pilus assembly protein PilF
VARADLPRPTRRFAFPAWALAAAALAAVALALVAWKAWPRAEPPAQRIALAAYQKRVAAWKASLPTPPGTAAAHEKQGRALLREDTPEALRSAREEFRRAAVLDPEATGAVAGYVEAGALLGFSADEREAIAEARDLIDFAAGAAGQNPAVLRANAHLLLSLPSAGNLIQARTLAEAALQRSDGAPEDLVAVGRSYIATNVDLALHSLDEALRKDPQNRRALLYRGEAKERVARYAAAADDYERRLALSPGDPEALRALLRVTAGVGAFDRLRRILDGLLASHPGDPEARLGLGILAYQIEGDARRAAGLFAGLIADRTLPAEVRARAAAHAAALAREAGDLDEAGRLVAGVTEPGAVGAPARYQEALVDLARGRPDEARAALAAIPTGVLDEGERALLEGRIHVAGTRLKEAAAAFQAAQRASPRRIDPYLHLAAANARLGEPTGAFGALRGALDLDPAAGRDRRVLTDFYESPTSRLAGLEAPLRALADERVDRALAHAAAGVVRYHQGEAGAAVPLLEHALDLDPQTMPALAYLAQIALDRGQATRALELARTASRLERLLALGPFLEGRAEEALDRPADARAAYERALDANPSFHPAAVRLGALSLREGNRAEAERRFFQVFQGDPENSEAKVALFQLGR